MQKRLTASGEINGAAGNLKGFYVSSTTAGTIVLRHIGASGTQISGTITPGVGWHYFPALHGAPLYATIGGTLDVTFFFE